MLATYAPYLPYYDTDGTPIDGGRLYFGTAGQNPETAPITVYWDEAGTQPAAQPIALQNGYPTRAGTPAIVYASGDYSQSVRDRAGALVYYAANASVQNNALRLQLDMASTASGLGADMLGLGVSTEYTDKTKAGYALTRRLYSSQFATLAAALSRADALGVPLVVDQAYSLSTDTITVPAGLDLTINATLTFTGTGKGLTLAGSATKRTKISGSGKLVGPGNSTYVSTSRAISIEGTNNAPSAPTYVLAPEIEGIEIDGWGSYGLWMAYTLGGHLRGTTIKNIGYGGLGGVSCTGFRAYFNTVDGVSPGTVGGDAYGMFLDRQNGTVALGGETSEPRSYDCIFAYNKVKNVAAGSGNNGQGLDTHGGIGFQFVGNMIENCEVGIAVTSSSIDGVQQLGSKRCKVIGNTITGAKVGYGILVSGAMVGGVTVNEYSEDIELADNHITGHGVAGSDTTGAIFAQGTKRMNVRGGTCAQPACYGLVLGAENIGFNVDGLTVEDAHDNVSAVPGAVKVGGNNCTGRIANITARFVDSGLATNVMTTCARIGSSLTGLDVELSGFTLLGIDATHLSYSEATTNGVNSAGLLVQRGTVTLSAGTFPLTFAKRMPTTSYRISLSTSANETIRWASKSATGFTINSSNAGSTAVVEWTATT